jgi:YD repeat-containing protein
MKKILLLILLVFFCDSAYAVTYVYDDMDRIIRADYGSGSFIEYVYDAEGNITDYTSLAIVLLGDINNDTRISLEDAMLLLKTSAGVTISQEVLLKADLDKDQKMSATELLHVLQKLSSLRQ